MIKSKEEIIAEVNRLIGEEASDDVLAILENVTDTIDDYERRIAESGDWQTRYTENDKAWRERSRERFVSPGTTDVESIDVEAEGVEVEEYDSEPETFEDLFEEVSE